MRDLQIRAPNHMVNMILVRPAEGLPHLPELVMDATVDQVLDMIVKTFHGTILYETCAPPEQYDIVFAGGGYIILRIEYPDSTPGRGHWRT
jgi:hypothetical protein